MPDWKQAIRERLAPMKLDPASETEIVEELARHLEDRYQELAASGIPAGECHRGALTELDDRDLLARGVRLARPPAAPRPVLGTPRTRGAMQGLTHDAQCSGFGPDANAPSTILSREGFLT